MELGRQFARQTSARLTRSTGRGANEAVSGALMDHTNAKQNVSVSTLLTPAAAQLEERFGRYTLVLRRVPESCMRLTALQCLSFGCSGLVALREPIWRLADLWYLHLDDCSSLVALPESLGRLTALQSPSLKRCSGLLTLPESFGQLTALKTLNLDDCSELTALPESLGQLTALRRQIKLDGCSSLAMLPG